MLNDNVLCQDTEPVTADRPRRTAIRRSLKWALGPNTDIRQFDHIFKVGTSPTFAWQAQRTFLRVPLR
jgi:hypothetical protein